MSAAWAVVAAGLAAGLAATPAPGEELPRRVRRIVLHVLGNPSYGRPELRFSYFAPVQTQALWKRGFGAHWIVWTDGSLWPRRRQEGQGASWAVDPGKPATPEQRRRLAWEAAPVFSHLHNGNSRSLGIELAHSGRRSDPFPPAQLQSLAWLLRTLLEMSGGRLDARAISGHKDLDRRPAYVHRRCSRPGCPVFVDERGHPYRRRVDPPEALFVALARLGLVIPRPAGADDDLARAERLPAGARPSIDGDD